METNLLVSPKESSRAPPRLTRERARLAVTANVRGFDAMVPDRSASAATHAGRAPPGTTLH